MKLPVLTLAVAVILPGLAQAQEARDFCADRPGKGSPSCVLDAGRFQAELGLADASFQRSGPGSSDAYSFGDLELRLGVAAATEAQLAWTPYSRVKDRASGDVAKGVGDLTLALRHSLKNPDGSGVSIALQPFVTAPTASGGQGGGAWQAGLIAPMSFPLNEDWSLALSPELDIAADGDGRGHHLTWSGAAGISRGFGPVNLGVELWASLDDDPAGDVKQASFDLTAAWTPIDDLQFDIGVYGGLTKDTPDLEVAVGIARRF